MLLNGMDARKLFGEVDKAVAEALATRPSKLDVIEPEEWTADLLKEDAAEVHKELQRICEENGWTVDDYNRAYITLRDNRHHVY